MTSVSTRACARARRAGLRASSGQMAAQIRRGNRQLAPLSAPTVCSVALFLSATRAPAQSNPPAVPQQYSFNVLQCNPGTFCCRAAYDTTNCCDNNATTIQTSHIGTLELPGATAVNTTFNASQTAAAATCPSDHTAAVGGALGGILAAVVIGSAIALILLLRQRKSLQQELSKTNTRHETEIAQIVEQHNVQSAKMEYSYTHAPPPGFGNTPTPAYQPHQNRPVEMDDERQLSELSGSAHPGSPPQRELSAG